MKIYSITFPSINIGYAVGDEDCVLKTTDGGNNWNILSFHSSTHYTYRSAFFTDVNTGFAVGDTGLIVKTTDGGNTWIHQPSGFESSNGYNVMFYSTYFLNKDTGYVVGGYNTIIMTTDGGNNWITQQTSATKFVNSNNSSTDFKTGQNNTRGTNPDLLSVTFPVVTTGYIVGGNGTILKSTSTVTSITETKNTKVKFDMYPNPVVNELNINTTEAKGLISVYSINGQELVNKQITESNTKIDFSNFPSGVYFIKLVNDKSTNIEKIVKR
jgi:photosystem II stability/assembly factor-like uncharacterized protein